MHDHHAPDLDGEIYNILDACSNDELAPIVAILVGSSESMLKRTRAFERYNPDHRQYTDQIGDEIYRLAITALGHVGETRPTFPAMLAGVRKQIGLPAVSDGSTGHYDGLVNVFASQHLLSVPVADRQGMVGEACVSAGKAASGILSSDAWPPFVSALLHLAYLRRVLADDGRMLLLAAHLPLNGSTFLVPEAETVFARLEGDKQTLTLAVVPDDTDGWQSIGSNKSVMEQMQPLIKATQSLIATYQMVRPDTLWREGAKNATASIRKAKTKGIEKTLGSVSVAGLIGPTTLMTLASSLVEQQNSRRSKKS